MNGIVTAVVTRFSKRKKEQEIDAAEIAQCFSKAKTDPGMLQALIVFCEPDPVEKMFECMKHDFRATAFNKVRWPSSWL